MIESGNPSQRLPWQHISSIFVTSFSAVRVPSMYTQRAQLVLCSSRHFDYCGVCMGVGSDCSTKCAVDAAVSHEPLV